MMGTRFILLLLTASLIFDALLAQEHKPVDSFRLHQLEEVVVTATRNERALGNVAVPVTIVSHKDIEQAGSLRLKDILQEQTGLFLTSGFGTGLQMQGLNPDYTMILLDGEPLVGRTAGILDLNRLALGNVKKIEIVQGPSSSLYGSEALAGVINIISDQSYQPRLEASFRYGTYNSSNASLEAAGRAGKWGMTAFLDRYHTDGYSVRPYTVERSSQPIDRLTAHWRINNSLSDRASLSVSVRFNRDHIQNELAVANNGQLTYSKGRELNKDWNIAPVFNYQLSARVKTALRLYGTLYEGSQQLATGSGDGYDDYFRQQFYRMENQTDVKLADNLSMLAGLGYVRELVNSNRYNSKYDQKSNQVKYGFAQAEWKAVNRLTLLGGFRYDDNRLYASALSPKLAALYKLNDKWQLRFSFGKGFKAPDFRQLYLNFTNTAAGGYSVFGALEAQEVIDWQAQQGLIAVVLPDYYLLQSLQPEISTGWNAGFTAFPLKGLQWKLNLFRNDIKNLIESRLVATRKDNSQIYSYLNVQEAYTQGLQIDCLYQPSDHWTLSTGYQYLLTADKKELAQVKTGQYYYTRDQNNYSIPVKKSDYVGLPNRSRHMANMKITYEQTEQHWYASLRAIYRSQWVVFDRDGNGIYNKQDEFAPGFLLFNASAGLQWKKGFRLQAGVDNILNYADAANLPNMPGRVIYAKIAYSVSKQSNNK